MCDHVNDDGCWYTRKVFTRFPSLEQVIGIFCVGKTRIKLVCKRKQPLKIYNHQEPLSYTERNTCGMCGGCKNFFFLAYKIFVERWATVLFFCFLSFFPETIVLSSCCDGSFVWQYQKNKPGEQPVFFGCIIYLLEYFATHFLSVLYKSAGEKLCFVDEILPLKKREKNRTFSSYIFFLF